MEEKYIPVTDEEQEYDEGWKAGISIAERAAELKIISSHADLRTAYEKMGPNFVAGLLDGYRNRLNEIYYKSDEEDYETKKRQ